MILGLSGKALAGKDAVADYLLDNYSWTRKTGFAINLKVACMEVFNLTEFQSFEQDGKGAKLETVRVVTKDILQALIEWMKKTHDISLQDKDYSKLLGKKLYTPREIQQFVGTEIMRFYSPDYHLEVVFKSVDKNENVIIKDVRFENEAQAVLDNGGNLVRIYRPEELRALHGAPIDSAHASEVALDDWTDWSYSIQNDSTDLNILYAQINTMLEDLKI